MGQKKKKKFPGYYFLEFWYVSLSIISEPFSMSFLIQSLNLEPVIRTHEKHILLDHHIITHHLILWVLQWDLEGSGLCDRKEITIQHFFGISFIVFLSDLLLT